MGKKKYGRVIAIWIACFVAFVTASLFLYLGKIQGWLWCLVTISLVAFLIMGRIETLEFGKNGIKLDREDDNNKP